MKRILRLVSLLVVVLFVIGAIRLWPSIRAAQGKAEPVFDQVPPTLPETLGRSGAVAAVVVANNATGASDKSILGRAGMPALNFMQNSNDYFHYHHTPNDTFDKIIPEDMRYLTAAYTAMFYMAAEMDVDFRQ